MSVSCLKRSRSEDDVEQVHSSKRSVIFPPMPTCRDPIKVTTTEELEGYAPAGGQVKFPDIDTYVRDGNLHVMKMIFRRGTRTQLCCMLISCYVNYGCIPPNFENFPRFDSETADWNMRTHEKELTDDLRRYLVWKRVLHSEFNANMLVQTFTPKWLTAFQYLDFEVVMERIADLWVLMECPRIGCSMTVFLEKKSPLVTSNPNLLKMVEYLDSRNKIASV